MILLAVAVAAKPVAFSATIQRWFRLPKLRILPVTQLEYRGDMILISILILMDGYSIGSQKLRECSKSSGIVRVQKRTA